MGLQKTTNIRECIDDRLTFSLIAWMGLQNNTHARCIDDLLMFSSLQYSRFSLHGMILDVITSSNGDSNRETNAHQGNT